MKWFNYRLKSLPRFLSLGGLLVSLVSVLFASTLANAQGTTTKSLAFDNTAWHYDSANYVYWQIGVVYAATPATTDYESLGIYVPAAYLSATGNGNGTFTATPNAKGSVGSYTTASAPIVFPMDTPGYAATAAPKSYSYSNDMSSFLKAGFIYIQPGLRGRTNGYDANKKLIYSGGAPWGVTDMKAAIRYYRYNQSILPGNTNRVFVFGMSGGGAQTSLIGATGDSDLYLPYLKSIGAALTDANGKPISDAIFGAMAWCPITSLDFADAAYEWNMGQYASTVTRATTTWTSALSKDLAEKYAEYLNGLNLVDKNGNVLKLEKSTEGIYAAGSYYNYLKGVVEESLNNFLADTTFPYTKTSGGPMGGPGGPGGPGGAPNGAPDGQMPAGTPVGTPPAATSETYKTAQEYIDSLNANGKWVIYDPATKRATITSLAAFVMSQKPATKGVTAFDSLSMNAPENQVFGNGTIDALHFDVTVAGLLTANQSKYAAYSDWKASLSGDYTTSLKAVDGLGKDSQYRQNMYNPMYYLLPSYAGYQKSTVAPHWRIRTGLFQGDTASTVEVNLALALGNYSGVKDVDFATVWGQGHVEAERIGGSTDNFIAWVNKVVGQ